MSEANLLYDGLMLTLFGMGFVFVFLILLVFVIRLMSIVVQRWFPEWDEPVAESAPEPVHSPPVADPAADPHLLAVISEAVRQHRRARHH